MTGYEFSFMGHIVTFDLVTVFGLLCAIISFTGFGIALSREHRMKASHPHAAPKSGRC